MSELPVIDSLKIANREIEHLRQSYLEAIHRSAKIEILAEALRDERDKAIEERDKAQKQLATKVVYDRHENSYGDTVTEDLQDNTVVPGEVIE